MAEAKRKRRTPQGVRGLKCLYFRTKKAPSRRTPQGVRGLKFKTGIGYNRQMDGRTPQGVRGLKCDIDSGKIQPPKSHPARGAWIEITWVTGPWMHLSVAPRKGCVD